MIFDLSRIIAKCVYSGDPLTMGYFDDLDNEPLNKYKQNIKNRKKFIDVFFYL
jgi:hypothetical protein